MLERTKEAYTQNVRPNKEQEMIRNMEALCCSMFGRRITTDHARRIVEQVKNDLLDG